MADMQLPSTPPIFVADGAVRHESVRVAVRIRPLNDRERLMGARQAWRITDGTIIERADEPTSQHRYAFDHVFDETKTTASVYQMVAASVVNSSMQGINGTIFAYGQTSSGKTHTMMGNRESPGIIPYALSDIFQFIQEHGDREFLLRVSHIEIYNEVIRDLLNPDNSNLRIQENYDGNIVIPRLTEENVRSPAEVMNLLLKGQASRQTAATNMNEESSRSHSIFRLGIESRERQREGHSLDQVDGGVQIASLNLVDLAGSERVSSTGATGNRLKEGGHINKSLLTLGKCIRQLSEGNTSGHIPFRESKLTRILAPALGGNSSTVIVCAVTPASAYIEETVSTINFASRAKTIQNIVMKNEIVDEQTQIHRLQKEIANLKTRLRRSDESYDLRIQCEDKARQLEETQSQYERLKKLFIHSQNVNLNAESTIAAHVVTKQESNRSAVQRRRTVDPATFSIQSLGAWRQERDFSNRDQGIVSEQNNESVPPRLPSDIKAENHDVATFRKENQIIRDRCARAETNLEMAEFELKKALSQYQVLKEEVRRERAIASHKDANLSEQFQNAVVENTKITTILSMTLESACDLKEKNLGFKNAIVGLLQELEEVKGEVQSQHNRCFITEVRHASQMKILQNRNTLLEQLFNDRVQQIEFLQSNFAEQISFINHEREILQARLSSVELSMQERILELENSLTKVDSDKASLISELAEARQRFDQVASLSGSKQEQYFRSANERALKKAESEADRLKSKICALEESSAQSRKEVIELKNQRAMLERNLKMTEKQIASRENEVTAARNAAQSFMALQKKFKELSSVEERSKLQVEDQRRQILEFTEQLHITHAQLEHYEVELDSARKQLQTSERKISASESSARGLNSELDSLRNSFEQQKKRSADNDKDFEKLRIELDAIKEQLQLSQTSRHNAEENAVQAHFRLEEVSGQLQDNIRREVLRNEELTEQLSTLQQQHTRIQDEYDRLVRSSNDEKCAMKSLSSAEIMLRSEIDRLKATLQQTECDLQLAQQQLSSSNTQYQIQQEVARSVQTQLQSTQKQSSDLRARNTNYIQKYSQLSEELSESQSALQKSEARQSDLVKRNEALEDKVSNLSRENQQLLRDMSSAKSSNYLQSESELRRALMELQKEIEVKSEALEESNRKLILVEKNNSKKVGKLMQVFKEYSAVKGTCSNCGAVRDQSAADPHVRTEVTFDKENYM